jgi:hypothetical protein
VAGQSKAAREATFTIAPRPRASMPGSSARLIAAAVRTLMRYM